MEKQQQLMDIISRLENKNFGLYFFVLDTNGNPTAGIANIYEHVKILNELGYRANILHEKNSYKLRDDENGMGVEGWMGKEYADLPHLSIESQQLNVGPSDFIIIPEIFANIMDQVKGFPCKKVVFSQSYDYLLELLPIGKRWNFDFGFNDVITTSNKQATYISNSFPTIKTHVVPVSIPSYFKPSKLPRIPTISILARNQSDVTKIVKSFYLQFPIYKWVSFFDMRGLSREKFAEQLGKSCLAIFIDDSAGFGTFGPECFESNTPLIAKMPNMIPDWMETTDKDGNLTIKNNAVYTNTTLNVSELIATFIKCWLEDGIPNDLIQSMKSSTGQYTSENQKIMIENVYSTLVNNRKLEFISQLPQPEPMVSE